MTDEEEAPADDRVVLNEALLEIESTDIIRLILQFLKEHNLERTLHTLQEESSCCLNAVNETQSFAALVQQGKWDQVLQIVGTLSVQPEILHQLYQQVVYELVELREVELARQLLRETAALQSLKLSDPDKFKQLEHVCARGSIDPKEAYEGIGKERRRNRLSELLTEKLQEAPEGRLLALIGMALKWQQHQGLIPPGSKLDLFRGITSAPTTREELCPQHVSSNIRFGAKSHPECCIFSPDGQYLVTGSTDGFVEVWDWTTGKYHSAIEYQNKDQLMLHDKAVLALAFSRDSEILASASEDGQIKLWKVSTGECKKKIDKAHEAAITSIQFSRDHTNLLTASFDTTARIHGVRTGSTIKLFRGHKSYVNNAIYAPDGSHVITCSSDGKVRVWDAKTSECRRVFSPPPPPFVNSTITAAINKVVLITAQLKQYQKRNTTTTGHTVYDEQIYVCVRCPTLYAMNLGGTVTKTFSSGKRKDGDFVDTCVSPQGDWIFGVAEDNTLYCFSNSSNKLEHVIKVHTKDVLGVIHHPHHSVVATWGLDGCVKILKP
eukprot:GHVS01011753.1.p1 GENE.GHVS01011753.1~~GHVS01011753.1.p1  ORF type:complete len:550 (-),score=71.80 GHVS01011753.1:1462-3111(-)